MITVSGECSHDADPIGDGGAIPPPDEGADPVPWTGCETSTSTTSLCGLDVDGGGALIDWSVLLANPLLAHQSYEVIMRSSAAQKDQGITIPPPSLVGVPLG